MNELKQVFADYFGHEAERFFSAPGRTEIGGNHTDHQHGCVLAAAVDTDMRAAVAKNSEGVIRVYSKGYEPTEVYIHDLRMRREERGTTAALVRGIAAAFRESGETLSGMDIAIESDIKAGSGLSSSAALEVLIGKIIVSVCCEKEYAPEEIAMIGKWAENEYFGKPCGLMDQMACALGALTFIDFNDPSAPVTERVDIDLKRMGYALCIVDVGANHADLTSEYSAITEELKKVCRFFGKEVVRELDKREFMANLAELRRECGDRAVMRALHIFADNERAIEERNALRVRDIDKFLRLVNESGKSSLQGLQNVTPAGSVKKQPAGFVIMLLEELLGGRGAVRIHGGGFGGTVQAFVPLDTVEAFRKGVDAVLGEGACSVMSIRQYGCTETDEGGRPL